MEKVNRSRWILEIIQKESVGNTLRVYKALMLDKLLISNNQALKESELYNNYMFIYDNVNEKAESIMKAMRRRKIGSDELKLIQLDILKKVDSFCRDNNLTYYLAYGTLLGAVRHKGYIPWDDDIDIVMPRPDYERFKKEFYRSDDYYEIRDYEVDSTFLYASSKVEYKISEVEEYVRQPSKLGVNIDIFVLDGIKDDDNKIIKKLYRLNVLYNLKQIIPVKGRKIWKNFALIIAQILLKPFLLKNIIAKTIRLAKNACDYDKTEYVCALLGLEKNNKVFKKEWFQPIEIEFEGHSFIAPANYDEILKGWYGDYMKLPPLEQQVTHHKFSAYVYE